MGEGRARRVAELVKQEVASLLTRGVKDPRVGFVSVMEVRMSPDLRYANVYVSLYGSEKERKGSLAGLRSSTGWVRREIGKRLRLRHTPELRFYADTTLEDAFHLEDIFREIRSGRQADDAEAPEAPDRDDATFEDEDMDADERG